jgi:hypothetical protein
MCLYITESDSLMNISLSRLKIIKKEIIFKNK